MNPQDLLDWLTQTAPIPLWRFYTIAGLGAFGLIWAIKQAFQIQKLDAQIRDLKAIAAFTEQPRRKGGGSRAFKRIEETLP